jgi:fido (protein-threonine AMPylation protein)
MMQFKKLFQKLYRLVPDGKFYNQEFLGATFSRLIYASSVVEGISLAKKDVAEIVNSGTMPFQYKNDVTEAMLQAYGQKQALDWIEEQAKIDEPVTIGILQELHYVVFKKIDENAGDYRNVPVSLRKSSLNPSMPVAIRADINDFGDWLKERQEKIKKDDIEAVVELVARTYHMITKIHPFIDGNGRTARLFINLILRKYSLPYIVIPKSENVSEMRRVLQEADAGDYKPIIKFMGELLEDALKEVLNYWEKKN